MGSQNASGDSSRRSTRSDYALAFTAAVASDRSAEPSTVSRDAALHAERGRRDGRRDLDSHVW